MNTLIAIILIFVVCALLIAFSIFGFTESKYNPSDVISQRVIYSFGIIAALVITFSTIMLIHNIKTNKTNYNRLYIEYKANVKASREHMEHCAMISTDMIKSWKGNVVVLYGPTDLHR